MGMTAPVLGRIPGRCPSCLDSKYLGAWKGPHLFGCILSHLLHSEFLHGKGDGGKTTGRASLPAVRKVMVKLTWALLGDVPEPREASSLVLPLNLSAVGLYSDSHPLWSRNNTKSLALPPLSGKNQTKPGTCLLEALILLGIQRGKQWQN